MSSALGAHSSHTVRSGGSSTALRRTFAVRSIMRSASSMTMTRQRPCEGAVCARTTICRTSSIRIWVDSVLRIVTSPFVRARVVTHPGHCPHPGTFPVHCKEAAKAMAATDRPEPGGPVMSHAWVMERAASSTGIPWDARSTIARAASAACRNTARACSWPTTSSQTLTGECRPLPEEPRAWPELQRAWHFRRVLRAIPGRLHQRVLQGLHEFH